MGGSTPRPFPLFPSHSPHPSPPPPCLGEWPPSMNAAADALRSTKEAAGNTRGSPWTLPPTRCACWSPPPRPPPPKQHMYGYDFCELHVVRPEQRFLEFVGAATLLSFCTRFYPTWAPPVLHSEPPQQSPCVSECGGAGRSPGRDGGCSETRCGLALYRSSAQLKGDSQWPVAAGTDPVLHRYPRPPHRAHARHLLLEPEPSPPLRPPIGGCSSPQAACVQRAATARGICQPTIPLVAPTPHDGCAGAA